MTLDGMLQKGLDGAGKELTGTGTKLRQKSERKGNNGNKGTVSEVRKKQRNQNKLDELEKARQGTGRCKTGRSTMKGAEEGKGSKYGGKEGCAWEAGKRLGS